MSEDPIQQLERGLLIKPQAVHYPLPQTCYVCGADWSIWDIRNREARQMDWVRDTRARCCGPCATREGLTLEPDTRHLIGMMVAVWWDESNSSPPDGALWRHVCIDLRELDQETIQRILARSRFR